MKLICLGLLVAFATAAKLGNPLEDAIQLEALKDNVVGEVIDPRESLDKIEGDDSAMDDEELEKSDLDNDSIDDEDRLEVPELDDDKVDDLNDMDRSGCRDRKSGSKCRTRRGWGWCTSRVYKKRNYARYWCRKTCGVCRSRSRCRNINSGRWCWIKKRQGRCGRSSIRRRCKKTCGRC